MQIKEEQSSSLVRSDISIAEFKKLLGSEAQNLTDKEIEQIRNDQYKLADILFEMWWKDKKDNKKLSKK